jgi:hypothetical protein
MSIVDSMPLKTLPHRQDGIPDHCPDENLDREGKPHRGERRRATKGLDVKKIVCRPERDTLILDYPDTREDHAGHQDADCAEKCGQKARPPGDVTHVAYPVTWYSLCTSPLG